MSALSVSADAAKSDPGVVPLATANRDELPQPHRSISTDKYAESKRHLEKIRSASMQFNIHHQPQQSSTISSSANMNLGPLPLSSSSTSSYALPAVEGNDYGLKIGDFYGPASRMHEIRADGHDTEIKLMRDAPSDGVRANARLQRDTGLVAEMGRYEGKPRDLYGRAQNLSRENEEVGGHLGFVSARDELVS